MIQGCFISCKTSPPRQTPRSPIQILQSQLASSQSLRNLLATASTRVSRLSLLRASSAQPSKGPSQELKRAAVPTNLWQTHLSSKMDFTEALEAVVEGCSGRLGSEQPHLALIFVSSAFADEYHKIVPELRQRLPSLTEIVGCSVSLLPFVVMFCRSYLLQMTISMHLAGLWRDRE